MNIEKNNLTLVQYLSCQAVRCTAYVHFFSGRKLKALALASWFWPWPVSLGQLAVVLASWPWLRPWPWLVGQGLGTYSPGLGFEGPGLDLGLEG